MAPARLAVALAWLLLAPAAASASDTVYLRPRGWPPIECQLSTQHAASGVEARGDDSSADFWLRGTMSRQFYRCRLLAPEHVRNSLLVAGRGELVQLAGRWTINPNKFRRAHWPDSFQLMSATKTPQFSCLSGATALPAAVFPLSARRPGADWSKCFPLPDKPLGGGLLTADGALTIQFSGGAPTVVCGVSLQEQPSSLPLQDILPPPYACFFATYLDFPSLSDPPADDVFQKLVADKWVSLSSSRFPPFQCWSADDYPSRPFHYDVLFDGKHAHRCLFQVEAQVSTESSVADSSSRDVPATAEDRFPYTLHANVDSLPESQLNVRVTGADGIPDGSTTPSFFSNGDNTVY